MALLIKTEDFDIKKIAESGQCFRLYQDSETDFRLTAMNKNLTLHQNKSGVVLDCSDEEYSDVWYDYFDMNTDYASIRSRIPESDEFLYQASEYGKGIRILKQDTWEVLITFIISQRKNIPSIQKSVEALCKKCGSDFFPSKEQIRKLSLDDLASCSLGYRAPYIYELAHGDFDIKALDSLDDTALSEALMKIKGVGIKVANCTSLFGFHRLNCFPIDVWIKRILDTYYNGFFDAVPYSPYAGVIQQYMFYYGRTKGAVSK